MANNPTRPAAQWRPLIGEILPVVWPRPAKLDTIDWIEAQIWQESGGDPRAESHVGARGLMQLMPGTAAELGVVNSWDPRQNIVGGVTYLRKQFEQLGEVPDESQRLLWAFASYNGGRGYVDFNGGEINTALELAKARAALTNHRDWWEWDFGKLDLPNVVFKGRRPDWKQMVDYVDRIRKRFALIQAGA